MIVLNLKMVNLVIENFHTEYLNEVFQFNGGRRQAGTRLQIEKWVIAILSISDLILDLRT